MSSETEGGSATQEGMKVPTTELPLTQQVFAWSLRALGYTELQEISNSTLKNAQSGRPIPRRWDDLVHELVRVLGGSTNSAWVDAAKEALRSIDQKISELPRMEGISRRAILKAPLSQAFRALGSRLGALIAVLAMKRGQRVEEWGWLARPFEAGFFGQLVDHLLDRALPEASLEEKKQHLEHAVDWRTLERWKSGEVDVPNVVDLTDLAACLGEGAELHLRLARLAACWRRDLAQWCADEEFVRSWSGSVTGVAQRVAGLLSSPCYFDQILSWYHDGLASAKGDRVLEGLKSRLGSLLHGASRQDLIDALEAARRAGPDSRQGRAVLQFWLSTIVIFPHPICMPFLDLLMGTPSTMLLAGMDPLRLVGNSWMMLRLCESIAYEGNPPVRRGNGEPLEPTQEDRAAARRILEGHEHWSMGGSPQEDRDLKQLTALLGGLQGLELMEQIDSPTPRLLMKMRGRELEEDLCDDEVRRDHAMCLRRARRLAEGGDSAVAIQWFLRAEEAGRFAAEDLEDCVRFYVALAHNLVDKALPLRIEAVRQGVSRSEPWFCSALTCVADEAELRLEQVLPLCQTPSGGFLADMLVVVVPALLRIALIRDEISEPCEAYDYAVEQLALALEANPTHGRLWAVWALVSTAKDSADAPRARSNAGHFGAAAHFEREWARVEPELRLQLEP